MCKLFLFFYYYNLLKRKIYYQLPANASKLSKCYQLLAFASNCYKKKEERVQLSHLADAIKKKESAIELSPDFF